MMLVPAGKVVDAVIESLLAQIDREDILIDGGNSFFTDTDRREAYLQEKGHLFFWGPVSPVVPKEPDRGRALCPGDQNRPTKKYVPIFEGRGRKIPKRALRGLFRTQIGRKLRENGTQRHRIRTYATDFGNL